MGRTFVEVSISADQSLTEHLVVILSQLGFEGFWEDGALLKCYVSADRWTTQMPQEVETTIKRVARSSGSVSPQIVFSTLEDQNWNEQWEKTIKPLKVTERITVTPTWHNVANHPGGIVLTIDPKMSFGTGYHETTRLSLRLLEQHMKSGVRVLDIGTGTGILAIASAKFGAEIAVGLDIDEWAYDNARENVSRNDVESVVTIVQGQLTDLPPQTFDLIIANIQRDVIEVLLPGMVERLADGGTMILSGLLITDRDAILQALRSSGIATGAELSENEWIAIAGTKRHSKGVPN